MRLTIATAGSAERVDRVEWLLADGPPHGLEMPGDHLTLAGVGRRTRRSRADLANLPEVTERAVAVDRRRRGEDTGFRHGRSHPLEHRQAQDRQGGDAEEDQGEP